MDGIKPIRKIKPVQQSGVEAESDVVLKPSGKFVPHDTQTEMIEFVNQRLFFEGQDIAEKIRQLATQSPAELAGIASALEMFKKESLKRRKKRFNFGKKKYRCYDEDELSSIFALCDIHILKIAELIKKRFDATKDGLDVVFDEDGQLVLNGMNIHAYVERCRSEPNAKSLAFLRGIRRRLELVLENKVNSRNYDRIEGVVTALFVEIDAILGAD